MTMDRKTPTASTSMTSHGNILTNLLQFNEKEKRASLHLKESAGKEAGYLTYLFFNNIDSEVFEIFIQGLKKKLSDIQLSKNGYNPLNDCISCVDNANLAVFLNYGANPNRAFYEIKEDKKVLCPPPLLVALQRNRLAIVRLLVLFGAAYSKINYSQLAFRYQVMYSNIPQNLLLFCQEIEKEVNELKDIDAHAQQEERNGNKDFLNAFYSYIKVGNKYLDFVDACETECTNEISKHTLPTFYMRQALLPFEKAIYCFEKYIQELQITPVDILNYKNILKDFYDNVAKNLTSLRMHPIYHHKFNIFKDKWKKIDDELQERLDTYKENQTHSKNEYSVHEKLISSPSHQEPSQVTSETALKHRRPMRT
jgi:hypothetical protein